MTIKEFFSFKQNKFFWINLIAMVIVVWSAEGTGYIHPSR